MKGIKRIILLLVLFLIGIIFVIAKDQDVGIEQVVVEGNYKTDDLAYFADNRLPVYKGNQYGYIDRKGELVIKPNYSLGLPFNEGIAAVRKNRSGNWGYIDVNGEIVVPLEYDNYGNRFLDGVLLRKNDVFHYYNLKNQKVEKEFVGYEDMMVVDEHLIAVKVDHQWGIMDYDEAVIIPTIYEEVGVFNEGMVPVKLNGSWGFVNETGEAIIDFEYDTVSSFNNKGAVVSQNGQYGIIDKAGDYIAPLEYDHIGYFNEDIARVYDGELYYLDEEGNSLNMEREYSRLDDFFEGFASVTQEGQYGYINRSGDRVIPNIYKEAYPFADGLAVVRDLEDKLKIINPENKVLLELNEAYYYSGYSEGVFTFVTVEDRELSLLVVVDKDDTTIAPYTRSPYFLHKEHRTFQ
ncbi:WG repeat protein [Natranaerovirga hydrolytica]|uniref:WG repeat protein n=1 Tax=Natranaerovirga hydrolytica TaxID=680378 RepID=A0A4V2Q0D1_9FIRM|nr:WG repeat-containing protein [Natranaerovirga hydrolytica]TCK93351.1 WG repeat protein [Natranaerovirga hydrolytica]